MKEIRDRYDVFLKVCETGSFSKAADALDYTQSGISQMMAALEEELEVQLFARAKKGVALTDNGIRLLPYIRDMVNQKEKLMQAAFNINNKIEGKLRIGCFTSVTAMWMPDVIHYFRDIITLFYGGVECVHIDVYNFSSSRSSFNSPIQRYTNFSSSEVSADRHK